MFGHPKQSGHMMSGVQAALASPKTPAHLKPHLQSRLAGAAPMKSVKGAMPKKQVSAKSIVSAMPDDVAMNDPDGTQTDAAQPEPFFTQKNLKGKGKMQARPPRNPLYGQF